jgi:hypothetical protein
MNSFFNRIRRLELGRSILLLARTFSSRFSIFIKHDGHCIENFAQSQEGSLA